MYPAQRGSFLGWEASRISALLISFLFSSMMARALCIFIYQYVTIYRYLVPVYSPQDTSIILDSVSPPPTRKNRRGESVRFGLTIFGCRTFLASAIFLDLQILLLYIIWTGLRQYFAFVPGPRPPLPVLPREDTIIFCPIAKCPSPAGRWS